MATRIAITLLEKRLDEHKDLTSDVRITWRHDEDAMRDVYYILQQALEE